MASKFYFFSRQYVGTSIFMSKIHKLKCQELVYRIYYEKYSDISKDNWTRVNGFRGNLEKIRRLQPLRTDLYKKELIALLPLQNP